MFNTVSLSSSPAGSKNIYRNRYSRYNYRTTARPERDRCHEIYQEINGLVPLSLSCGTIETTGLIDYLFYDSYEDLSVVDLYKFVRDDNKNEYKLYETVKKAVASETNTGSRFQQLMSDPTKRLCIIILISILYLFVLGIRGIIQSYHPYERNEGIWWNVETD